MDDESWSHWAQGRGKKSIAEIISEQLVAIQKRPQVRECVKRWCETVREYQEYEKEGQGLVGKYRIEQDPHAPEERTHKIAIQLPAAIWGEAYQRVGVLKNGEPVSTSRLLAALILESESWKQSGDDDAEFRSGWTLDRLVTSVALSTKLTYTKRLRLGRLERGLGIIVAVSAVASTLAAWISLLKSCG